MLVAKECYDDVVYPLGQLQLTRRVTSPTLLVGMCIQSTPPYRFRQVRYVHTCQEPGICIYVCCSNCAAHFPMV